MTKKPNNPYLLPYHWGWGGFMQYKYEWPLELVKPYLHRSDRVLDIGCGDGRRTALLAAYVGKVVGLENQPRPLEFAKLILEEMPEIRKKIIFQLFNGTRIPQPDASFDAVTAFDVIEHIPVGSADAWLTEVRRVLKPHGVFICLTPNRRELRARLWGLSSGNVHTPKHFKEYSPGELEALLGQHGLETEASFGVYIPPLIPRVEHYASIFPFDRLFRWLVRLGKRVPTIADTMVLIARKRETASAGSRR